MARGFILTHVECLQMVLKLLSPGLHGDSMVQHGHGAGAQEGLGGEGVDPEALADITRTVQVEMAQQVRMAATVACLISAR